MAQIPTNGKMWKAIKIIISNKENCKYLENASKSDAVFSNCGEKGHIKTKSPKRK